jgi:hypothetical protein
MFQMHRIFCANCWELEAERRAFHDIIGNFNEDVAMKDGVLYVPVSLVNIADKRPHQFTVNENIEACRHFLLVLSGDWGPVERNFQRDYALALKCAADPALPMRETAFLLQTGPEGQAPAPSLPTPDSQFSTPAEFQEQFLRLLHTWHANVRSESAAQAAASE